MALMSGWIVCQGRHCLTRVIQAAGGCAPKKHHSALYRFFSRSKWVPDALGRVVVRSFLAHLQSDVLAIVDDTLCHRTGPHIFGGGMHHDAGRSSYGRGGRGRFKALAFGLNWVVVAIHVPMPWDRERGLAIPVLFRLYRCRSRCPAEGYRKRTELAVELIHILHSWIGPDRRLVVCADHEYACRSVLRQLPPGVQFIGPVLMHAALHEPAGAYKGMGRPRKKGDRLPSPAQWLHQASRWTSTRVRLYGRDVSLEVKSRKCLWYCVAGCQLVRLILTRDPRQRFEPRAFFSTDPALPVAEILQRFSRRWSIEAAFRDAKQHLGLEDPQNGWGKAGLNRNHKKVPGPQPRGNKGEAAIRRTLPIAFTAFAVVVLWYLRHGNADRDLQRNCQSRPWYRKKARPSFLDMLIALRRATWAGRLSAHPARRQGHAKAPVRLPDYLLAG
ncbi:MAG: transposase [Planctomycetes bacterium]|nr:transposase [Planctomycetota bacterium]MCB9892582.1 transposase [Planctomycetota bacterium]